MLCCSGIDYRVEKRRTGYHNTSLVRITVPRNQGVLDVVL